MKKLLVVLSILSNVVLIAALALAALKVGPCAPEEPTPDALP